MRGVSKQERMTQQCYAPSRVRKQPAIFCFTLGIRTAGSAVLSVNGTLQWPTKQYGVGMLAEADRSLRFEERSCCPGKFRVSIDNATLIERWSRHRPLSERFDQNAPFRCRWRPHMQQMCKGGRNVDYLSVLAVVAWFEPALAHENQRHVCVVSIGRTM